MMDAGTAETANTRKTLVRVWCVLARHLVLCSARFCRGAISEVRISPRRLCCPLWCRQQRRALCLFAHDDVLVSVRALAVLPRPRSHQALRVETGVTAHP